MKPKLIVFALLLSVLTIVGMSIAVKSCKFNPEPTRPKIYEKIQEKHSAIGVSVINRPADDTAGLYRLEAFKKKLAAAALRRQIDSLSRLQNNR